MKADSTVLPEWYDDRDITYAEVSKVTEVPIDTIYGWHRLVLASGAEFGEKFRNDWHFSTRELIAICMAASLRQIGYPVGLQVLKDIAVYVRDQGRPERPFVIGFEGCPSVVLIDGTIIHESIIEMMTQVRAQNA